MTTSDQTHDKTAAPARRRKTAATTASGAVADPKSMAEQATGAEKAETPPSAPVSPEADRRDRSRSMQRVWPD